MDEWLVLRYEMPFNRITKKKKLKLKKKSKKNWPDPPSNKDHAAHKNTTGNNTTLSAIFIGDVIPKQSFGFGLELNDILFCSFRSILKIKKKFVIECLIDAWLYKPIQFHVTFLK